jgi:glycosyltransferase involved in cell wall biosynthesis
MRNIIGNVDIALATYNGEKYLNILLDSLKNQVYQDFIVHICDDGSTDSTIQICEKHSLYHENKLIIHEKNGKNGAYHNFRRTLNYCNSDYIALCDQDDYWHPNKIERMLSEFKKIKNQQKPILIFSDLLLVDQNMKSLGKTFYNSTIKSLDCTSPIDFIFSNHIPGCSMFFNRELKEMFTPMPKNFPFHDWWIALCASFYGEIISIEECLISYRQHDNNTVGIKPFEEQSIIRQIISLKRVMSTRAIYLSIKKVLLKHIDSKEECEKTSKQLEVIDLYNKKKNIIEKIKLFYRAKTGENKLLSFLVWIIM